MRDYEFRKKLISIITAFLMLTGSVTGSVPLYAAQNTVSADQYYVNDTESRTSQNAAVSADETEAEETSGKSPETEAEAESTSEAGKSTVSSDSAEAAGNDTVSADIINGEVYSVSSDEIENYANHTKSENDTDFYIPIGALDDDTEIDSPEPLREFETTLTEQSADDGGKGRSSKKGRKSATGDVSEPAAGAAPYAVSYNSLTEGFLPTGRFIDQGNSSLCWAFSAAMLGDISMIKSGAFSADKAYYSPDQAGYFFYNRTDDPLGNTAADFNTCLGGSVYNYYNRGGNNSYNTWSLASWIGERDHEDMPFTNKVYTNVDTEKAYYSDIHLQDAYWTNLYTANAGDISYVPDVKELIYDHGGVSTIIFSSRYINENHAVYGTSASGGHNVTFIGWDDNYPKENFTITPPGNGAWYVRDSYDGDTSMDENGCYWMSYYDRSITGHSSRKAIAFDFEKGDNYDNNYQYDGAAGNFFYGRTGSLNVSNVFRAKDRETLKAVGFAPASTSMSYTINIYKLHEGYDGPIEGESLSTVSGDTRFVGFRTVKLTDPVELEEGDIFSVVIDLKDTSGNNKPTVYVDCDGDSGGSSPWVSFTTKMEKGQSYVGDHDLVESEFTVRIKAYTDNADGTKEPAGVVSFQGEDQIYNGTPKTPGLIVRKGVSGKGKILSGDIDYTVSYNNNVNAGRGSAAVSSDAYRIFNNTLSFNILPKELGSDISVNIEKDEYIYNGTAQKVLVNISDNTIGADLLLDKDYIVDYSDNINVGKASAVISGIGNYKGSKNVGFSIVPKSCDGLAATVDESACVYTGTAVTPEPVVSDPDINGRILKKDVDYTVSYNSNINSGKAELIVSGTGNYEGTKTAAFNILPKSVAGVSITGIESTYEYTGVDINPEPTVTDPDINGKKLIKDTDYTVEYSNNKDQGEAKVTIKGIGNYTGQQVTTFFISKAEPLQLTVANIPDQTFIPGGDPIRPELKVKHGSTVLNKGSDYTAAYIDNTDAGTAQVYITGVSKTIYDNSSASKTFTIKPFNLKNATVAGISDQCYVEGKTYTVSPVVRVKVPTTQEAVTLKEDEDYTVSYENNEAYKSGQKVTVHISGINNYTGSIKKTFILRGYIPISDTESFEISLSQYEYDYDGTAKKPQVKVKYRAKDTVLTEGSDYKVTYASNKNAGTAKVTVKPTNSFTKSENVKGSAVILFTIKGKTPDNLTFADISDKTYTGKQIKPKVTVYENGKKLAASCYYVEYTDNVNAGDALFTVYGKKNYSGKLGSGSFVIKKRQFNKVKTSYKKSTDTLTVKYGNAVLRENIDYERDASVRLITSLETNFEAGTKKY